MVLVVFEDQVDDSGERDLALGDARIANLVMLRGHLPALARQHEKRSRTGAVRRGVLRLLLRTSVLERVNGPLADLLTGSSGGERVLQDLEEAGAFVVSLEARRSWFRYHRLFADLLQLQLRRSAQDELPALHRVAAGWCAGHGYPVEAVRHAQVAQEWGLAARLLSDQWFGGSTDGWPPRELLSGFPAGVVAADAELAALMPAR